jgi:hypothetical protein
MFCFSYGTVVLTSLDHWENTLAPFSTKVFGNKLEYFLKKIFFINMLSCSEEFLNIIKPYQKLSQSYVIQVMCSLYMIVKKPSL